MPDHRSIASRWSSGVLPSGWETTSTADGRTNSRNRHTPEQVIRKLREADADLANGMALPEVCKKLGIAENTYYRWRNQYGGIKADEMKRLKDLEKENLRLRRAVSDLTLDKLILQEAARGNF